MAENKEKISKHDCWQTLPDGIDLKIEWEREVQMDWLGLIIPVKLAVICLFIVVIVRYYWGA